jgi:hypothetical protein
MDVLDFDMRSVVARCSTVTGVRRRAACCEERWERRGRGLGWDGAEVMVERRRRRQRPSDELACRKSRSKQCLWSGLALYFGSQAEQDCVLSRR